MRTPPRNPEEAQKKIRNLEYFKPKYMRLPSLKQVPGVEEMIRQNLRLEDVAAMSGLSYGVVKRVLYLEKDPLKMNLETLVRVSHALGVAPVEVMPLLAARPKGSPPIGQGDPINRFARAGLAEVVKRAQKGE